MRSLRPWPLVAIAMALSYPAFAWGPDGHRTVATLAEKLIAGSNAATQVQALLGNLGKFALDLLRSGFFLGQQLGPPR